MTTFLSLVGNEQFIVNNELRIGEGHIHAISGGVEGNSHWKRLEIQQ
jgi:hypothetical protein